jgi:hypothetical protein
MEEESGFFTPFGGEYCHYFYFLMIFFFIIFLGSLGLVLFRIFASKNKDNAPLWMSTLHSFVLYFQTRLLYSMCVYSLPI